MIPKPVGVAVSVFILVTCILSSLVSHPSAQREGIIDQANRAQSKAMHLPITRTADWVLDELSGDTTEIS